jgi:hypothetical protein
MLSSHVLNPAQLPPLLHTIRTSLFPNNAPAPPRSTPDAAEQRAIKRHAAETILDLVPALVAERFFAPPASVVGASKSGVVVSKSVSTSKSMDAQTPAIKVDTAEMRDDTAETRREFMVSEIEDVLDLFGDAYMNKHLIFGIVELVIVRLLPEVAEMSVRVLMETRLGEGWEDRE